MAISPSETARPNNNNDRLWMVLIAPANQVSRPFIISAKVVPSCQLRPKRVQQYPGYLRLFNVVTRQRPSKQVRFDGDLVFEFLAIQALPETRSHRLVRPGRLELPHPAPEAGALSTELRARTRRLY